MPEDKPKIGPFSIQVPPPSPNGHHTSGTSPVEYLRRAGPGLVLGLILCVSTVPQGALLRSADFAYWWRIVIAVALGGVACGLAQKGSRWVHVATGALVGTAGLLLAYALVRSETTARASATTVVADVARLTAWGVVVGGAFAVAAAATKGAILARREARTTRDRFV